MKIKIAVSSCLLGEAVRYDGTDKRINLITDEIGIQYNLISLCPEMAVEMGVPRPPIHLVDDGVSINVVGIANPENNMTKPLSDYGQSVVEEYRDICGYIFKKNSPSCGTKNVKVMTVAGKYELRGQGVYAATIIKALPLLPVIDEEDYLEQKLRDEFLTRVENYYSILSLRA